MMQNHQRGFSLLELSLSLAVGLAIIGASIFMYRQHMADARVQQTKMALATIRTQLAAYRYRTGQFPTLASMSANDAGGGQRLISGPGLVTSQGSFSEPFSGIAYVYPAGTSQASNGGWLYDPTTGAVTVNLSSPSVPGEDPSQW